MFQINIGDWTSKPAALTRLHSIGGAGYSKLRQCRWGLIKLARENPACNAYFRSLSGGRSLTALLNDSNIWVSHVDPCPFTWGESWQAHKAIGLTTSTLIGSKENILVTLIHEFAHINGADGSGHAAEAAVFMAGYGTLWEFLTGIDDPSTPYDPTIMG